MDPVATIRGRGGVGLPCGASRRFLRARTSWNAWECACEYVTLFLMTYSRCNYEKPDTLAKLGGSHADASAVPDLCASPERTTKILQLALQRSAASHTWSGGQIERIPCR